MYCKHCGKQIRNTASFCKFCGQSVYRPSSATKKRRPSFFKIFGIFLGVLIFATVLVVVISALTTNNNEIQISKSTQDEIASSVVNILCPSTNANEEGSGGTGVIMSTKGVILTNSHIIPQTKTNVSVGEVGCLVILPDPSTGQAKEMYLADPIVYPDISEKYDLAFLEIYAAYYDSEEKKYYGTYPREFLAFDDTARCNEENIQLGEPVRIFGYPAISAGGYSLTITDGLVSSIPGDGTIITSAKISNGNSGGLAVDRDGCMIGVPSMVSTDTHESLGVIISSGLIRDFVTEITNLPNQQP